MDQLTNDGLPRIGAPATRALEQMGITRTSQLNGYSKSALLALHGVGPKAVRILEVALMEKGLSMKP